MSTEAFTAADGSNVAAVLHGIGDLRVQPWPLPDEVAPGHVSVHILQCKPCWKICSTSPWLCVGASDSSSDNISTMTVS
jgi:hypothetical protein